MNTAYSIHLTCTPHSLSTDHQFLKAFGPKQYTFSDIPWAVVILQRPLYQFNLISLQPGQTIQFLQTSHTCTYQTNFSEGAVIYWNMGIN